MRTILVVDDDPWVRVLARDVLAGEGYRVLEASDGQDAIGVAAEHPGPIHLLLTDVTIPDMDGPALAAALRKERGRELRLLYMSGYADQAIVRHGVLDADVAYLPKPFTTEAIARRVRDVLDAPRPPGAPE